MQYVRSVSSSVSGAWRSINPATLSGAIDVVVVSQSDGSLACSPFHIRFGKFSLLRPSEKKVEFRVNGEVQPFPMKLGEGGEAFFVFGTDEEVPEGWQTSPLVSPVQSPLLRPSRGGSPGLGEEPDPFSLEGGVGGGGGEGSKTAASSEGRLVPDAPQQTGEKAHSEGAQLAPPMPPPQPRSEPDTPKPFPHLRPHLNSRTATDSAVPLTAADLSKVLSKTPPPPNSHPLPGWQDQQASSTPNEAYTRALSLSKKLWSSNIANTVTPSGDLMLDMTSLATTTSSSSSALHIELVARQLLSEEIDGPYDIGALIGADEKGNIWIYASEEAKDAAGRQAAAVDSFNHPAVAYTASMDALSDPGYQSDDARSDTTSTEYSAARNLLHRRDSDSALGTLSGPNSPGLPPPPSLPTGDPNKNYAKTLRLTSSQLASLPLHLGPNTMSFTVNRATCTCNLYYYRHDIPIVISDIDGTITKSDVLGQVLNTLGRDWTHLGVAKLYTEIAANGYNFLYLTSRGVGQADSTRAYLDGVVQEGHRLPKGPVILSPDRTLAALRREVYLRKPEIFKMACLRDIMALFTGHGGTDPLTTHTGISAGLHAHFGPSTIPGGIGSGRGKAGSPFYAGFGNRLTDALSYRSVNIPSTRIFTINSNGEVSLDLLSLNSFKTAYGSMREIVDHYFPPVGLLVKGGGEEYTDFNYWREKPLDVGDFTDSDSDSEEVSVERKVGPLKPRPTAIKDAQSLLSEDEAGDDEGVEAEMLASYLEETRLSLEETLSGYDDDEGMTQSMLDEEQEEDGDDEDEEDEDDEDEDGDDQTQLDRRRDVGPTSPVVEEPKVLKPTKRMSMQNAATATAVATAAAIAGAATVVAVGE